MILTAAHMRRFKTALAHATVALLFGLGTGQVMAAISISNVPLDTLEGVPANIIVTMDDSGSMAWGFMPDSIGGYDCGGCANLANTFNTDDLKRATSVTVNKIYYDPTLTYVPAVNENRTSLGDATFTAAWDNGFNQGGSTTDLSANYQPIWGGAQSGAIGGPAYITTTGYSGVAFYHQFDSSNANCDGTVADNDCYTKVEIVSGGTFDNRPDRSDCVTAPVCTYDEEKQNFANWYSYYRYRQILAKTAATMAFSQLSGATRIAYQALNSSTTIGDLLPLTGAHRTAFFDWIYNVNASGGTPLRAAFKRAGEKYSTARAYEKEPGVSGTPSYTCRQNFHFAFTDGSWNGSNSNVSQLNNTTYNNYDNTSSITLPETVNGVSNYTRRAPYQDSNSLYLGDIALYFWAHDLSNLTNDVSPFIIDKTDYDGDGDTDNDDIFWNPKNDPATWQHMVNYTVGFGVAGNLTYPDDYDALVAGTQSWGNNEVDDLWHAAINSRGEYFSASNPQQLVDSFASVLTNIDSRTGSSSAVATTSSQYQAGTNLFQAVYDPATWTGDIVAKDVLSLAEQWSAADVLAQQIDGTINSPRQIITFDPSANGGGIPFQWGDLDASQQTALNTLGGVADAQGANRLAYLRGDNSNELHNSGVFRNRLTTTGDIAPLGDVVHSDPFFLPPPGAPLFFWPDDMESVAYSTFVAARSGRQNMVLFGGNDGMLHIVNANTGREILAYVPSSLYPNLSALTNPSYTHQFYVDQPINVSDVFYNGSWHTVAIGGLGKGGQGIYALDITNPGAFQEANADSLVLWEFTEQDDADLGYTYTKPQMFKMNNGEWMVAFGNGYNNTQNDGNASANGDAQLFLLDIEHGGQGGQGTLIKLTTAVGAAEDPTGLGRANRLTDVVAVDQNQDFKVDILYAGDLFGNLWKFDVSSSNTQNWTNGVSKLFQARDDNNNPQPITVPPAVQYHDKKNGFMVFVGTGKYLEVSDPADSSIQTVYGIWDREESSVTVINRASLLEQKIEGSNKSQFTQTNARITTNNRMIWYDGNGLPNNNGNNDSYLGWYMDLGDIDNNGDTIPQGERVLDDLFVSGERLEFITLIPSTNPCVGGGESWIFAVNGFTGSRFTNNTPWDYNLDGRYDSADKVDWGGGGNQVWGSGINLKTPQRFRRTKLLEPGSDCQEINLLNNSDGSITTVSGSCQGFNYGRRSWRQIHIR